MKHSIRIIIILGIVLFALPLPLYLAQSDTNEMESFFDSFMEENLAELNIPGAALVVVQDGEIILSKGYGFADVDAQIPVDPAETVFRVGSVSKLFTATAVMQLVEQGKLELNADVNTYLKDFKIPDTYPEPITLAHLLTHSAGFKSEMTFAGPSQKKLAPLNEYVIERMPRRVHPPGTVGSYSNYSISLAGHIVAQVSGMSWEEYIEEKILKPLEMFHSTARQPLPDNLAADLSAGCTYTDKTYEAVDFEYLSHAPAASMSSTAIDMAHFMIAHLQGGQYKNKHMLKKSTIENMYQQHFTRDPKKNGMGYGFFIMDKNNQNIVGPSGVTRTFHSLMWLLPEHKAGVFISVNTAGGQSVHRFLFRVFTDYYFPGS